MSDECNTNAGNRYLQYLLEHLFKDDLFSISIQDTSGVLHMVPELSIDNRYRIHTAPVCTITKLSTKGLNSCNRLKRLALNRFKPGDTARVTRCHMGLCEVTRPVFINEKLSCVVYIGSFLPKGKTESTIHRCRRYVERYKLSYEDLSAAYRNTQEVELKRLEKIIDLAESIAVIISMIIEKSKVKLIEMSAMNKLNKNSAERMHWAVAYIMEYVDMYFNRDIRLKNISKLIFMNEDYMGRLFRMQTGKTFNYYLNEKRISESARIIESSKDSFINICHDVGYKNKSHFNKMFKRFKNITPLSYRKKYNTNEQKYKHNPSHC